MKPLLLVAGIVVALIVAGVIHVQKTGNDINITIDKTKLQQTESKLAAEGEELLHKAEAGLQNAANQSQGSQAAVPSLSR